MQEKEEFFAIVAIYGGIIFAGILVSLVLVAIVWKLKGTMKEKTIIKKLYEQQNKNGKGGSHGHH